MSRRPVIEQAVQRGMAYLDSEQRDDGSFASYSSVSGRPFKTTREYRTTFVPSLMLAALSPVTSAKARSIRDKLSDFLLAQRNTNGAFNYWTKAAPESKKLTYPDDLDDTFCAYIGLYLHDPALVDTRDLAQIVKLLLATESRVGGPYRTWLASSTSDKVWLDIDLAVNANIAYFLSLVSSVPPNLQKLMNKAIIDDQLSSPYYPSAYPIVYYLSRAYQGTGQSQLLNRIRQLQQKKGITALELCLCTTARIKLGDTSDQSATIGQLLADQQVDGSWPAAAFCIDPAREGQAHTNGCAALTTALACESLQLHMSAANQSTEGTDSKTTAQLAGPRARIISLAKRQYQELSPELRQTLQDMLVRQSSGDTGTEIINLAWRCNESLATDTPTLSKTLLDTLGLANLYGWIAYTVYDDFLDGEGRPELLSAANVAARYSIRCFSEALAFHRPYQALVRQIFDTIDGANAWEQAHCRLELHGTELVVGILPNYGDLKQLAERSMGHALPVLAVLLAAGVDYDSPDFSKVHQAIIHYLIARQLNDDLHDWEEDLAKGRITYVVTQLLSGSPARKPGNYQLSSLTVDCRQQFWHTTLPRICREMERQVVAARHVLRSVKALKHDNVIMSLLSGIEVSISETLAKQDQARSFLQSYGEKQVV
jgi:hypothetical protein